VAPSSVPAAMQEVTLIGPDTVSTVSVNGHAQSPDLVVPAQPDNVITTKAVTPTSNVATADLATTTKTITTELPATVALAKPVKIATGTVAPGEAAAPPDDENAPLLLGSMAETQVIIPASQDDETRLAGNSATANLRDPAQEITIRAVAASWVEIVRDNGEEVLAKLMQVGDSYVVEGNTRLYLSTGNAGGLEIVIGSDDPLPVGETGQIVRDLPLVTDKLRQTL
jgi:cytoskeleton protein RodZ